MSGADWNWSAPSKAGTSFLPGPAIVSSLLYAIYDWPNDSDLQLWVFIVYFLSETSDDRCRLNSCECHFLPKWSISWSLSFSDAFKVWPCKFSVHGRPLYSSVQPIVSSSCLLPKTKTRASCLLWQLLWSYAFGQCTIDQGWSSAFSLLPTSWRSSPQSLLALSIAIHDTFQVGRSWYR